MITSKEEKLYLIALASLLHDIGKFYQRTDLNKINLNQFEKDEYKYEHAFLTLIYLDEIKNKLQNIFSIDNSIIDYLIKIASKHHNPIKNDIISEIITECDRISSTEREKQRTDKNPINLLHPIFETVSLKQKLKESNFYYDIESLNITDKIFPKKIQKEYPNLSSKYNQLFNEFNNEIKNIDNFQGKSAFNFIYYLLQKYLSFIPSSTFDTQHQKLHYSDISLFDHSKVAAMLSTSLLDFCLQNNINNIKNILENQNTFLVIEISILGIQKFIYNIAKTTAIKDFSISKALRGRSTLVSLLIELIARKLLKKLNYPITNLLYSGGGKCQIIIANTPQNIQNLKDLESEIIEFMFNKFHLDLKILIEYQEFSIENIKGTKENFSKIIEKLQNKINQKKKQLLKDYKEYLIKDFPNDNQNICKSCKSLCIKIKQNTEPKELCELCELSNQIGKYILDIEYISFDPDKKINTNLINNQNIFIIDCEKLGNIYLITNKNNLDTKDIKLITELEEILVLNKTDFGNDTISNGFKFIANTVPVKQIINYISLNDTKTPIENISEDIIMDFETLSNFSIGDKKLAALRADIDNLGIILSQGLKSKNNQENKNNQDKNTQDNYDRYTFSRIATLSRMLDLFFSGYINTLITKESKEYLKKYIKETQNQYVDKIDYDINLIYTVYSGGDDLFLIGPYNFILEFSIKLKEEFNKYVCYNPDFTLSAGILIFHPRLPINKISLLSLEQQKISKNTIFLQKTENNQEIYISKNCITIFNKTFKWKNEDLIPTIYSTINQDINENINPNIEESIKTESIKNPTSLENIIHLSKQITEYIKDKSISKSTIYKILEYTKLYIKHNKINPLIYPKLYYQIARNIKKPEVKEKFIEYLLKKGTNNLPKETILINLDIILYISKISREKRIRKKLQPKQKTNK